MEVLHKLTALSVFRSDKLFVALRLVSTCKLAKSRVSESTTLLQSIHVTSDHYSLSNEMNIRILSECQAFEWTVEHFSGNFSEKDEKKIKNTWEKNVILEILNAVM